MKAYEIIDHLRRNGNEIKELLTLSNSIKKIEYKLETRKETPTGDHFVDTLLLTRLLDLPLTLSMFVPCDKDGKPLGMPNVDAPRHNHKVQYHKAQQAVIFEGWEVQSKGLYLTHPETGNRFGFYSNGNVYFDQHIEGEGDNKAYAHLFLGTKPTLTDLANATTDNPLKLKQ